MFYYALSRNVQEGSKAFESITDTIVVRIQEAVGEGGRIGEDELHTALAVNTALNLGTRPPYLAPAVEYIMNSQHDAGSWPSSPYYCTPDLGQTWGSQELTTAFCLEALYRFQVLSEQPAESRQIAMSGYRTMPPDARLEERILRDYTMPAKPPDIYFARGPGAAGAARAAGGRAAGRRDEGM